MVNKQVPHLVKKKKKSLMVRDLNRLRTVARALILTNISKVKSIVTTVTKNVLKECLLNS